MSILLKNGNVIDPSSRFEGKADLLIKNGVIAEIGESLDATADKVIDCEGLCVIPGICDMHVHLRDPGQTHKEDIITGCEAAAAGGVTALACMPNTVPPVDNAETVRYIKEKAKNAKARVYPVGCITKGLKGEELCDYQELRAAGCVAVSDDGRPVKSAVMMAQAMEKAHYAGLKVISHCEDLEIIDGGIINEGKISKQLGVKGMSRLSEDTITARELAIAQDLQMPIHIAHVSTKGSANIIKSNVFVGVMCTCETAPHYLMLTDEMLLSRDADYRMNPPLREEEDVLAMRAAVANGTIDCIVTDHAPHSAEEKADFEKAPNGVVGLETSLAASLTALVHTNTISLAQLVRMMCVNPRTILGIEGGSLAKGELADIAIFDPDEEWTVQPEKLHSKSKNTCFKGMTLKGRVKYTLLGGEIVYTDGE